MSYTKLFSSIVTSTIWTEDATTCKVWVTMLAIANKHGEVLASIPGLAQIAGLGLAETEKAITKFMLPDKYSRTPDDQGRRIEPIDGGWTLLNHAKYRAMASKDEEKTASARRQAAFRDRKFRNGGVTESNALVTPSNDAVTANRDIAEAEADTEANTERERREDRPAPPPQLSDILPTGAAQDMLSLQSKIQGLKKEWKLALTYEEQKAMLANGACLYSLEEADWTRLRLYLAAKVPEGSNYWQPRNRGQFIASLPDVHGHACRWEEKQGLAPKKKGWS